MSKLKRSIHRKDEPRHRTKPSGGRRRTREDVPEAAPPGFGSRSAELERMWREQFPKQGREERIKRALEALQEMSRNPIGPNLDLETVKKIAEDPDLWEF